MAIPTIVPVFKLIKKTAIYQLVKNDDIFDLTTNIETPPIPKIKSNTV